MSALAIVRRHNTRDQQRNPVIAPQQLPMLFFPRLVTTMTIFGDAGYPMDKPLPGDIRDGDCRELRVFQFVRGEQSEEERDALVCADHVVGHFVGERQVNQRRESFKLDDMVKLEIPFEESLCAA